MWLSPSIYKATWLKSLVWILVVFSLQWPYSIQICIYNKYKIPVFLTDILLKFLHCTITLWYGNKFKLVRIATDTSRGEGEAFPSFFWKKKCPDFAKKNDLIYSMYVEFPIQNAVLLHSRRKNSTIFPYGACLSYNVDETFTEVPLF